MNRSHEIDYQIIGESIQIVQVELDPEETVIAEAGAMLYMEEGILFETKMGDGSSPNQGFLDKLISAGSRVITGAEVDIQERLRYKGKPAMSIRITGIRWISETEVELAGELWSGMLGGSWATYLMSRTSTGWHVAGYRNQTVS